jgi:uncharacterized protein with PQ loop repeat
VFDTLLLPILLAVANLAGAGMVAPQVVRLHRTRIADGVSAVGAGVGIAMNLWWIFYATTQGLWGLLPVAAGAGVLYVAMAILLIQTRGAAMFAAVGRGHLIGLVPLAALVGWGWRGAGLAIGLLYGAQFAPALVTAIRSPSLFGISTAMWLLAWVEASIWLVYGVDQRDAALTLGGGGGAAVASLILICLAARRPRMTHAEIGEPCIPVAV